MLKQMECSATLVLYTVKRFRLNMVYHCLSYKGFLKRNKQIFYPGDIGISFQNVLTIYKITRLHKPEDRNLNFYRRRNLKFSTVVDKLLY